MDTPELVEALSGALAQEPRVRLALLFGSRARGAARPGSDADVAVAGVDVDVLHLANVLTSAAGCEVDVIRLERASIPMLTQLVRDAITIYEAEPGAAASWRVRALLELETDGPWYAKMRDAWLARVAERGV